MSGFEALLTGRLLADRYRIDEVIGRGGMGAVYRASDERLGRSVAVKVITAAAGTDPEARERIRARFRHEAASAARLPHHPNVVPVYDYGTDPALGLDFLVMELLRGEDLASSLARKGPPPLGTSLRILEQAARGVAVGHRQGLVHRDVKPGNVFLVEDHEPGQFQVRVLDFGIAKMVADEDTHTALTMDGRAPLSPAYASPEQLRGEQRLTPASDVFSLGALGFQLLTATRPFSEQDRNRMSLGMEVPVPSLRARAPSVPPDVEEIVRRAMAHDPAARFPTAGAMADALTGALRALDADAASSRPAGAGAAGAAAAASFEDDERTALAEADRTMLAPAATAAAAGVPGVAPPPPPVIPPRRRTTVEPERKGSGARTAVLLVVLAAGLGAGGWFVAQSVSGRDETPPPLANLPDTAGVDSTVLVEEGPDPADALILDREGRRMLLAGDAAAALGFFRRAVEQVPDNASYRDNLAYTLLLLGRPAEAAAQLEQVIEADPRLDVAYSHLAEAQLALGDTTAAVDNLRIYLTLSRDPDARRVAQDRLRVLTEPRPAEPVPAPGAPVDTVRLPAGPPDSIRIP